MRQERAWDIHQGCGRGNGLEYCGMISEQH